MRPSDPWAHTAPLPDGPYPRYPRPRYPGPRPYPRVDPYAGRYDEDLTARYDENLVARYDENLVDPPNGRRRTRPLALAGTISAIVISIGLVIVLVSFVLPGKSTPTAAPRLPGLVDEPPAATLAPQPTPEVPTPTDTAAGPSPSADPTGDREATGNTAVENAVVAFVNSVRRQVRCDPVANDPRLRRAARLHSADMAAGGFLSHTGSDGSSAGDRMRAAGYNAPLSENLARGFDSAREVVQAWLGSREQRRNILDCDARAIGVGVAVGADGRPYWTQDFGR